MQRRPAERADAAEAASTTRATKDGVIDKPRHREAGPCCCSAGSKPRKKAPPEALLLLVAQSASAAGGVRLVSTPAAAGVPTLRACCALLLLLQLLLKIISQGPPCRVAAAWADPENKAAGDNVLEGTQQQQQHGAHQQHKQQQHQQEQQQTRVEWRWAGEPQEPLDLRQYRLSPAAAGPAGFATPTEPAPSAAEASDVWRLVVRKQQARLWGVPVFSPCSVGFNELQQQQRRKQQEKQQPAPADVTIQQKGAADAPAVDKVSEVQIPANPAIATKLPLGPLLLLENSLWRQLV